MKKVTIVILFLIFISGCNTTSKKPLIIVPGNDNIALGEEWIDNKAYAIVGEENIYATSTHTIDNSVIGEYEVTYTLENDGESYESTRYVWVHDRIKPEVTLASGVDTIKVGTFWVDGGVNASDNYTTDLDIVVEGEVDVNVLGTYPITYVVSDESNNQTTVIRYVTVVE